MLLLYPAYSKICPCLVLTNLSASKHLKTDHFLFLCVFIFQVKKKIKTKDLINSVSFYLHLRPHCLVTAGSSSRCSCGGDDARPPLQLFRWATCCSMLWPFEPMNPIWIMVKIIIGSPSLKLIISFDIWAWLLEVVVIVSLVIDGFMLGISMLLFCSEYQQLLWHCIGLILWLRYITL
jgi:hypothetical protein